MTINCFFLCRYETLLQEAVLCSHRVRFTFAGYLQIVTIRFPGELNRYSMFIWFLFVFLFHSFQFPWLLWEMCSFMLLKKDLNWDRYDVFTEGTGEMKRLNFSSFVLITIYIKKNTIIKTISTVEKLIDPSEFFLLYWINIYHSLENHWFQICI